MKTPDSENPPGNDNASPPSTLPVEISVVETRELIDSGKSMLLLDCREDEEVATCQIEGSLHIPMNEVPSRISEIEDLQTERLVIHCHHGGRSMKVTMWLRENGFPHAQNMEGGIDQWSQQVDPEVPRY